MSPISISLNLLLAALLLATLTLGWRLNRRLKALRDGHVGFAMAVEALDAAAARAERGLAELRAATDETVEFLSGRIEKGRELAVKLERLTAVAAQTPDRPAAPLPAPAPALARAGTERDAGTVRRRLADPEAEAGRVHVAPSAPVLELDAGCSRAFQKDARGQRTR